MCSVLFSHWSNAPYLKSSLQRNLIILSSMRELLLWPPSCNVMLLRPTDLTMWAFSSAFYLINSPPWCYLHLSSARWLMSIRRWWATNLSASTIRREWLIEWFSNPEAVVEYFPFLLQFLIWAKLRGQELRPRLLHERKQGNQSIKSFVLDN